MWPESSVPCSQEILIRLDPVNIPPTIRTLSFHVTQFSHEELVFYLQALHLYT
jgi:hypothetical protein